MIMGNHGPAVETDNCHDALHIVARVDDGFQKVLSATADDSQTVLNMICKNTASVIEANSRYGLSLDHAVNHIGNLHLQSTEKNAGVFRVQDERNHAEARNLIITEANNHTESIYDLKVEGHKGFCDVERTAADTNADVKFEMCETFFGLSDQKAEYNVEQQLLLAEKKRKIQMEALKNQYQLKKEQAECCCELKMKTDEKAREERLRLQELENERIRDEIAVAENDAFITLIVGLPISLPLVGP